MKKEELLKQCRYYNGHESNNLFADYERIWINRILENPHHFDGYIEEYKFFGLGDFNLTDGVPISLKALLFNRFYHWSGGYGIENDRDSFKDWYNREYLGFKFFFYFDGESEIPTKYEGMKEQLLWSAEKMIYEEMPHLLHSENPQKDIAHYVASYCGKWSPFDTHEILTAYLGNLPPLKDEILKIYG